MATPKSQRIGIWIITIAMVIGTMGSFMAIVFSMKNSSSADANSSYEDYLREQKIAAQLNADNSEALDGYKPRVFEADKVEKLSVEIIKDGAGEKIKSTDSINVSYFGYTSDGKIFDSSKKKNIQDEPISLALSGVIPGWSEGLTGIKAGSVVRLTIPADKAYGAMGSGIIPANAPLEFIIQIHEIITEV